MGTNKRDFAQASPPACISENPRPLSSASDFPELYRIMLARPEAFFILNKGLQDYNISTRFWEARKFVVNVEGKTSREKEELLNGFRNFIIQERDLFFDPKKISIVSSQREIPRPLFMPTTTQEQQPPQPLGDLYLDFLLN